MSAFVEVMVVGGARAYLDAASIMGIVTSNGQAGADMATADQPMTVILRSGDTIAGVHGISPNRLLLNATGARMIVRRENRLLLVAYLENQPELEAMIDQYLHAGPIDA